MWQENSIVLKKLQAVKEESSVSMVLEGTIGSVQCGRTVVMPYIPVAI